MSVGITKAFKVLTKCVNTQVTVEPVLSTAKQFWSLTFIGYDIYFGSFASETRYSIPATVSNELSTEVDIKKMIILKCLDFALVLSN